MSLVAMKQPFLLQIMYDDEPLNPRTDYDNFGHMVCWHSRYNLGDKHNYKDINELFMQLVRENVNDDIIIDYVKSGRSNCVKLEYDNSENGWDIKIYDDQEWWSNAFYDGTIEENRQDISQNIIEVLTNKDLYALASKRNIILPLYLHEHSGISMSVQSFHADVHDSDWNFGEVGWIYATPEDIKSGYGDLSAESYAMAETMLKSEVQTYDFYLRGQCYGFRLFQDGQETESCWGFSGELLDVAAEIAAEVLPESHRDMIDHFHEVSDIVTREKGYEDFVEDLEEMEGERD